MYAGAVTAVTKVVNVIGKSNAAKMFFTDMDLPGRFKSFAKEVSMILKQQQMKRDNANYAFQLEPGPLRTKYNRAPFTLIGGTEPPPRLTDAAIATEAKFLKTTKNCY